MWTRAIVNLLAVHPVDRKLTRQFTDKGLKGIVTVVYDLALYPVSYDFIIFLANADAFRRLSSAERMNIIVLSHDSDPIQDDVWPNHPILDGDEKAYIKNFILEACMLYEATGDIHLCRDRSRLYADWSQIESTSLVFPEGYTPHIPDAALNRLQVPLYGLVHLFADRHEAQHASNVYCLSASMTYKELARDFIRRQAGKKYIISITLREATHDPDRNSDISAWQRAIEKLDHEKYTFIVLRDFQKVFSEPVLVGPSVVECPEAVLSIMFRAALYEVADLNLMTNGGPASLCFLNHRCRYIVFMEKGAYQDRWYPAFKKQHGVSVGEDLPFSSDVRRLLWCRDDESNIISAIEHFERVNVVERVR
ncbi:hypothetical protein N9L49_01695 [Rhodospirillales bacterium]|nr:hypothetical protein [Rhodospirillales bacterium]